MKIKEAAISMGEAVPVPTEETPPEVVPEEASPGAAPEKSPPSPETEEKPGEGAAGQETVGKV